MNIKLDPEKEFKIMQQFFSNGGSVDNMPEELLRVRRIWKEADRLVRRYPYYDNEKIANQLMADLPEFKLATSTAKQHVTAAKRYYDFVETDSPETHRRILIDILYKQIAKLQIYQANNPIKTAEAICKITEQISRLKGLDKETGVPNVETGTSFLMLSSSALDFPDMRNYTDSQLYAIIEDVTDVVDLSPGEKKKLIDKDINGKLI